MVTALSSSEYFTMIEKEIKFMVTVLRILEYTFYETPPSPPPPLVRSPNGLQK